MESLKNEFHDLTGLFENKNEDQSEDLDNQNDYENIMTEVMSKRYFETYSLKTKEDK